MMGNFQKFGKAPQKKKKNSFLPNVNKKSSLEMAGEKFDDFLKGLRAIKSKPSDRRKMAKKIIKSMFFK